MRFDPYRADGRSYGYLSGLARHLGQSELEPTIKALVELRVSQINGCAFCLGLHSDIAHRRAIPQRKLDQLAGWRDSSEFTLQEGAALGLAEEISRIGDGRRVGDETWRQARAVFSDEELASLIYVVGLIQFWNMMNVAVELPSSFELPSSQSSD